MRTLTYIAVLAASVATVDTYTIEENQTDLEGPQAQQ